MKKRRQTLRSNAFLFLLLLLSSFSASASVTSSPPEASALLDFKSKADLRNTLPFSTNSTLRYCKWQGIECVHGKLVRLVLEGYNLGGTFASGTLSRLDQLRVLSLQNNSLTGPIPDLSGLVNLKSLFLDHNSFSGNFPPSISSHHRLRTVDLSYNNLTGALPSWLTKLDRLYYLRLDRNRFNGTIPSLNQSSLQTFNVSGNNLTGAIPVTPTLLHFAQSSFSLNPGLCGEIINKECGTGSPFFGPSAPSPPPRPVVIDENANVGGAELTQSNPQNHKRIFVILGFLSAVFVLIGSILCFVMAVKKQRKNRKVTTPVTAADSAAAAEAAAVVMRIEEENELGEKVKRVHQGMQMGKSGSLVFCAGEAHVYSLDQLMRGSAELLGRGTIGTTYKAVLDNRLIVCVKRLDGGKTAGTSQEIFERHMESVGGLRHPNLVPLRAYFQANEERLLIYDYQPNGSLYSLIHGSKSTRAKPLHWTSCLKIAEDVAQGLSYIHQAWRLVHGNLKSTNVLLGPDFEACLTDYCLSVLATSPASDADDPNPYRAPEFLKSKQQEATSKSDVYAFGILLLELVSGQPPSSLDGLNSNPNELMNWVRSSREDHDSSGGDGDGDESSLAMLVEVAVACSVASSDQRPTMWQVLKMIQEVKEVVFVEEDGDADPQTNGSTT